MKLIRRIHLWLLRNAFKRADYDRQKKILPDLILVGEKLGVFMLEKENSSGLFGLTEVWLDKSSGTRIFTDGYISLETGWMITEFQIHPMTTEKVMVTPA
jgi:hypothetical protein